MSKLITVATFQNPEDALFLRSLLESEEIPCRLSNEITISVLRAYSNGEAELQVPEEFEQATKELMRLHGYPIFGENRKEEEEGVIDRLNRITYGVPLLGRLRVEWRILWLLLLFSAAVALLIFYLFSVDGVPY